METNKNKTKSESAKKTGENQSKTNNPFEGLSGKGTNIPEWLMHLLTGVGAMGANYMLWIKPIQDKMETMNLKLTKQDSRIKELEVALDRLTRRLEKESNNERQKSMDEEYFTLKRNKESEGKSGNSFRTVNM